MGNTNFRPVWDNHHKLSEVAVPLPPSCLIIDDFPPLLFLCHLLRVGWVGLGFIYTFFFSPVLFTYPISSSCVVIALFGQSRLILI